VKIGQRPEKPGWYLVQPVIQGEPQAPTAAEAKQVQGALRFAVVQLPQEWRDVAAKEFDDWLWLGPFPSRAAALVPPPPGEHEPVFEG
jgi:hypothetical protein